MRRWLPILVFSLATVALIGALFFVGSGNSENEMATSVAEEPSLIVCRDGEIQQLLLPQLSVRRLFVDVDCDQTYRWQLSADFEQLLSIENVNEGSHVFVRSLGDRAYDLTSLMGLESTFRQAVAHAHPRFDESGRVTLVSDGDMLLVNPENGAFETVPMPEPLPTTEQGFRDRCQVENNVLQIAPSWSTQCPWGWFEEADDVAESFFVREIDPDGDDTVVSVQVSVGATDLVDLRGEIGVCAATSPRVYWVDGQLLCVGEGIGLMQVDAVARRFSVTSVVDPADRLLVNVVPSSDARHVYFTSDISTAGAGRELWRAAVGSDTGPESLGRVTELGDDGSHAPFTIFGVT